MIIETILYTLMIYQQPYVCHLHIIAIGIASDVRFYVAFDVTDALRFVVYDQSPYPTMNLPSIFDPVRAPEEPDLLPWSILNACCLFGTPDLLHNVGGVNIAS